VAATEAATEAEAAHNWWVLYLMIMATIMMIGMVLMALKMKIACSRFLCAVPHCIPGVCVCVCVLR